MEHSSWHALIKSNYLKVISENQSVYGTGLCSGDYYPPKEKVFQALLTTPLEEG